MEKGLNQPVVYEITIRGQLNSKWAGWLDGDIELQHTSGNSPDTTIYLPVPDQAALRGVLNKIWDLNLSLISLKLVTDETNGGGKHDH